MTSKSAQKLPEDSPIRKNLCEKPLLFSEDIDGVQVRSFVTSHDSLACVGYRFEFEDECGTRAVGYATDLGELDNNVWACFCGCEAIVVESNHDSEMLMTGPYPYHLKRRIQSSDGHLSNETCAETLVKLIESGTTRFFLGHLSRENNVPQLAYQTNVSALTLAGATEGEDYYIRVAKPVWDEKAMIL